MSIGSIDCPVCHRPIRTILDVGACDRISHILIRIDRGDVLARHARCFTPGGGGERMAA